MAGVKKKEKIFFRNIEVDSPEELEFFHWISEARDLGLVTGINYHPCFFQLSEGLVLTKTVRLKTKIKEKTHRVLHPHTYSPDFWIDVSEEFEVWLRDHAGIFPCQGGTGKGIYLEVKGTWLQNDRFPLNQKWVWERCGILVNKVVPKEFFKKTWVPEECLYTPKRKEPRTQWFTKISKGAYRKKAGIRTGEEFLKLIREV